MQGERHAPRAAERVDPQELSDSGAARGVRLEDVNAAGIEALVRSVKESLDRAVTLGKGKRLFGDGTPTAMLKMVDHKVTAKGTVIATYERGGTLPGYWSGRTVSSAL